MGRRRKKKTKINFKIKAKDTLRELNHCAQQNFEGKLIIGALRRLL
jgi:hypothetical protein